MVINIVHSDFKLSIKKSSDKELHFIGKNIKTACQ